MGTSEEVLARQFRLHHHRGIAYLATPNTVRSIAGPTRLAVETGEVGSAAIPTGGTAAAPAP
jgi:hypothetical protein